MKKVICYVCFAVVLGCIVVLNTSCSEKTRAINDLEELAKDVQKNGDSYGISEWKVIFNQYQDINAIIDRHHSDYSQKQHGRILKARSEIKQSAWDSLQGKFDLLPNSIKQSITNLFNSIFDSVGNELTPEIKE